MKKMHIRIISVIVSFILFITCQKDDTIIQYPITINVSPADGGSVSPSSGTYEEGSTVSLKAIPSSEYLFKNWEGGVTGTNNPINVVITSDKNVIAVFEKKTYTLTTEIEGEGTINEKKPMGEYISGEEVLLTAVPEEGWEFVEWSGDFSGTNNPMSLTINSPINIKAIFTPILYKQIIGKWDIDNSNLLDSKSLKAADSSCIIYSIVFNEDGSYILSLNSGEQHGSFYFDSASSIVLNNNGRFDNLRINNKTLNFDMNLKGLCSIDGTASEDDDYYEGECISFLNCNEGNIWVMQTEHEFKFIRVKNDLPETWLERYTFNSTWECSVESITNLTSNYSIILIQNTNNQLTYIKEKDLEEDIQVVFEIKTNKDLSVSYKYKDDSLNKTDHYKLSNEETLNKYKQSFEACSEINIDEDYDGVKNNLDLCKNTFVGETVDTNGCSDSQKDTDGDGVMDNIDICPNTPSEEIVNENGCSTSQIDSDEDGVMDNVDICPNTTSGESVDSKGCSDSQRDTDRDGVVDNVDACPSTPSGETVNENGCSISQIDSDEDGVMDNVDICLNTSSNESVNEYGCSNNQLTYIPDDNFEQLIIDMGYDNILDNYAITADILNVTSIIYNDQFKDENKKIKDLTGIEDFINLKYLHLAFNLISEIDLSDNTKLIYLNFGQNKVTSLNVKNNTSLTYLAGDNNLLTDLDVSNNTQLKQLFFQWNQLTTINIGTNKDLEYLGCDGNQLTSLDVSNNNNLEFITSQSNELSNINVNNNNALKTLYLENNKITNIDLSENIYLTHLSLGRNNLLSLNISSNTLLTSLFCSENSLTNLDVSSSGNLKDLRCENNQLTSLNVSNNTNLESLNCRYNELNSLDVSENSALTKLYCLKNNMSCIKLTQNQIDTYGNTWSKDASTIWSTSCD